MNYLKLNLDTVNVLFFDYNKATPHHMLLGRHFNLGNRRLVFPVFKSTNGYTAISMATANILNVDLGVECIQRLDAGLLLDMNRHDIRAYLL